MAKHVDTLTAKARRTRSDIIRAARGIVGHKGVTGVNVMEVCAVADVGRTSFYNYFDDIDDLVEAVATDAAKAIKAQFDALHSEQPRGLARLEKCLQMLLVTAVEDPETVLLLTSLAADDWPIRDMLHHEIVEELKATGSTNTATLEAQADVLTSSALALSRDIASARVPAGDAIPTYVTMLLAAAVSQKR